MKTLFRYLKIMLPVILAIFILGARPSKARGQDADKKETKTFCLKIVTDSDGKKIEIDTSFTLKEDENLKDVLLKYELDGCDDGTIVMKAKTWDAGLAYVYCISKAGEDGKTMTLRKAKTVCLEDDGDWTVTTEEDGKVRVIVKSKKDGESQGDIYIIKTCEKDKPEKK